MAGKTPRVFGGRWERVTHLVVGGQGSTYRVRDLQDGSEEWVLKRLKNLDRLGRFSRHSAASILLASTVHPRVVMELLGHSTIAQTMNTYSHVIPALQREAADRMEQALTGAGR